MRTRKLCVLGGVFLACLALFAETPDKFIRYVEATGQQAVDTGIVGRYGMRAEMQVEWMAVGGDTAFLDARGDDGTSENNTRPRCRWSGWPWAATPRFSTRAATTGRPKTTRASCSATTAGRRPSAWPVLLESGLAALWDSVSKQVFLPSAPFSAMGPVSGEFEIRSGTTILIR